MVAGCNNDNENNEVVVVGNENKPDAVEDEAREDNRTQEEEVVAENTESEEEDAAEIEENVQTEDDDALINNMEPNNVALLVNEHAFEIISEENREFYEQIVDIDGDGNDETVQILKNTFVEDDVMQLGHYILAIFDVDGEARYAEYTYNFIGGHAEPRIMDVIDLDDDGISEIIMENLMSSTAMAAVGLQSPSRFIYKYDESLGQFTTVPSLGRFLRNDAVDDYELNINDVITGLDYDFSYESVVENPESEGHSRDLIDYGILDENTDGLAADFVENTHGNHRYQYPSYLQQLDGSKTGVVYSDPVLSARWLTLNAIALYEYNPDYNWMEIVGMDGELNSEADVSEEREIFTVSDFSNRFDTYGISTDDYMGEWTMVIDGRLQDFNYMTINIDEEEITEIHVESGEVAGHNSEIVVDTMDLDNNTRQLKVTGEVIENDATDVNNTYDNTFMILHIEGTKHMIDKYGNFYLELD